MFSAPGAGLLIIPPVDAPLHLIEASFGSSSVDDALGCRLPEGYDNKGYNEGRLKDLSSGINSIGRRESQYPPQWAKRSMQIEGFHQARGISPRGTEKTVAVGESNEDHRRGGRDGVYAGKILVVSRGECTFERKVGVSFPPPPPVILALFELGFDFYIEF